MVGLSFSPPLLSPTWVEGLGREPGRLSTRLGSVLASAILYRAALSRPFSTKAIMPKPETPGRRKGATRRADIPPDVLRALNEGREETITLAEWLAIDMPSLLRSKTPPASRPYSCS